MCTSGFTLLEMLLVLFLMALVASAGLMLTEGVEDQAKYNETRRRMEMMRRAIVGDPTRTVNGSPEISGFVADMGRLPGCVGELLGLGPERTPVTDPRTFESPCDNTVTIPEWHMDDGIASGWRGPYIQVLPERDGELRFRDGYGNSDASDARNSGWAYSVYTETVSLASAGFDPVDSGDDTTAAELVVGADWQLDGLLVNFLNRNADNALPISNVNLNLRVYLSSLTDYVTGDAGFGAALTVPAGEIPASNGKSYAFTFDALNRVPIGQHGYAVVCYQDPPAIADDFVIFDGDCDSGNQKPAPSDIRRFTAVPRYNHTLDWIIP
jgi:prepilin-type N-terminal cleavage/methylation domain-containing protein